MNTEFDAIVVGSGPAGVSVVRPLLEAGLRVLLVDGGRRADIQPPEQPYPIQRQNDLQQWQWMLGRNFHALRQMRAVSPKLRVPTHGYVFEDFAAANRIDAENFVAVGSLAQGGLSNAWGCGVARFSSAELADFPCSGAELDHSYQTIARRIGISGAASDDLSDYFGLDAWAQPPIELDTPHRKLAERYAARREPLLTRGFRLGRARVAALTQDLQDRRACDNSGNCLWGCSRKALYSAADELDSLRRHPNLHYRSGFIVEHIGGTRGAMSIHGRCDGNPASATAAKVILAAGTLATTRLALAALDSPAEVPLQSCPTAAFLLWLPTLLGTPQHAGFGLGQLSFALRLSEDIDAFGSTFSTAGIPVAEFVRHIPLGRRFGIDVLRQLLGSCLVGNLFLPGHLSTTRATLRRDGSLAIAGGHADTVPALLASAEKTLRRCYGRLGALLLPMSFTAGQPGGDIHYSGTLPMRAIPRRGETDALGELAGAPDLHVVDGACLPTLPAKSHTLTIMANADRIGRALAADFARTIPPK